MNNVQLSNILHIQEASKQDKLVIFVGAGVSTNSGVPMWGKLIESLKQDLPETLRQETDDLKVAQLYKDSRGYKEYMEKIKESLMCGKISPNPIHYAILDLKPCHIITTNYDDLIEQAIMQKYQQYYVVKRDTDLPYLQYQNTLIKMHGDFEADNIVLTENDYYNYSYNCDGQAYISGGTTIACFDHTAHGYQDLRKAFANSCNSAFSTIGAGLNKTSFMNLCSTLLFNSNLPVGFEYSKSTMAVTQDSSISEMQETGIGQGRTMMTPLHNMMIAASVANDGVMMTPYIVDSISDSEGRMVVKNKPTEAGTVMSAEEAEYLTECMREVITSGTGNSMKYSSYEAAGKTGSAQYDDSDRYHSWFTGFAPYDNPQIAVCVILEGGYSGVSSAQVVAKAVFDTYFGY